MATTYTFAYDVNDDGTFAADFSADVLAAEWRLGMRAPFDSVASVARAEITVRNTDGRFSPEQPTSTLQKGLGLRVSSLADGIPHTHFTGAVAHIEPAPGAWGPGTAVIVAECPLRSLTQHTVRLGALLNTSADAVIAAVLDAVPTRPRWLGDAFMVGTPGRAELGLSTPLLAGGAQVPRSLGVGRSTFAAVGDTWDDGVQALAAIRDVVEAERGRFYVDREGRFVFANRHTILAEQLPLAAFGDDMAALDYRYGADVVSQVTVTLTPRSIGDDDTPLWTLDSPVPVKPGQSKVFTARYGKDADGRRVGALRVRQPRGSTDYRANTAPYGTGFDLTNWVELVLLNYDATSARLLLNNLGGQMAYLVPGSVIRGQPLYRGDTLTVSARDAASETRYGPHERRYHLPALTSISEAEDLARFELSVRAEAGGRVRSLMLDGPTRHDQALARTLFDTITVTETHTGHSGRYLIVGEAHTVAAGGQAHTVTWTLEPANPGGFWLVGTAPLGTGKRLGY